MKKFFFLALLSVLFLAVACPKHDTSPKPEELPPMTQTGANTFGCLLNGKVWRPGGGGISTLDPQYYRGSFSLVTEKKSGDSVQQILTWTIRSVHDTGKYIMKEGYAHAVYADEKNNCEYDSTINSYVNESYVYIKKLDTSTSIRIISGTFNFIFTNNICDTIRLTMGRFDVKYTY